MPAMPISFTLVTASGTDSPADRREIGPLGLASMRQSMTEFGMLVGRVPLRWPGDGEPRSLFDGEDGEAHGIPDRKLAGAEQLITAAQIAAALASYDAKPAAVRAESEDAEVHPSWQPWIALLRRAAQQGGLRFRDTRL
ncbi:hypothetical protein [Kitasatospora sp. NPDC088783]|uniref:hypothetical protein n=1 Tax=Kitasatospora sp. NPDC088783 TaxID=3364077 RepID=UPI00382F1E2D